MAAQNVKSLREFLQNASTSPVLTKAVSVRDIAETVPEGVEAPDLMVILVKIGKDWYADTVVATNGKIVAGEEIAISGSSSFPRVEKIDPSVEQPLNGSFVLNVTNPESSSDSPSA